MVEPSEEERILISQLREHVYDILKTEEQRSDHFVMRWLRARNGDLDQAEDMIRKSFEWRTENNVDSALKKPLDPFIKATFPYSLRGKDLQGRPVFEVCLGDWDIRKAIDEGKEEEFLHLVHYVLEEIVEEIRASNDSEEGSSTSKKMKDGEGGSPSSPFPNTQFTYLVNWEGYTYSQLLHWRAVQHLLKFASQYEAHYPEIMYKAVFINCPAIFPLFLSLLKTILAQKTLSKIEMFGSNRDEWEPALDALVEEKERSESFGGSLYHL
ncbi:SEC14-like protein 4 [Folsomia candida]|uniref:CRAL-TRIO domain-containing protein n=1 Tax=Folsomia candida TaxID=158441 RepID=A0A226E3F6_FOLCA|nr:SEC14-like protein 4 [Folsomia candida]OXA51810.1 hypothetical protein Fcan01_13606 [Folsomia candida]